MTTDEPRVRAAAPPAKSTPPLASRSSATSQNGVGSERSRHRGETNLIGALVDTLAVLRPPSAQHESDERFAERTSRTILSALAEPGDGVLGGLVLEYGAIEVLDRLWKSRSGAAGLGRHEVRRAVTRARDSRSADRHGAAVGHAGLDIPESNLVSLGRRPHAAHCDSSSEGGARDWGSSVSGPGSFEQLSAHDFLEPFRSGEWAETTGHTVASPRSRGTNRDTGSCRGSQIDTELEGLSASLETWMLRLDRVEQSLDLAVARSVGAELLIPGDDDWPGGVDDLGRHAPFVLWVRGSSRDLNSARPAVALVGARACSAYGQQVATDASWHLARRGVTVISGGAYGIDGAVHRAAIRADGRTVAFLAGGVDRLYPAGHHALLESIIDNGCLASEVPCGTTPTKWRFLQRNRLIAAASQATVVVEAGSRSGSLNTAGHAAHLGRPLGAVPGPVTTPHSIGCHRLLREYDATCVTSGDEMMQLIAPLQAAQSLSSGSPVPQTDVVSGRDRQEDERPRARRLIDALSARTPRQPLDLARQSGLPVADVVAELGSLQLRGVAKSTEKGWLHMPRKHR